jgi:hypothetical protein
MNVFRKIWPVLLCISIWLTGGIQPAAGSVHTFSFDSLGAYDTMDPEVAAVSIEAYMTSFSGLNIDVVGAIVGGGSGNLILLDNSLGPDSYLRTNLLDSSDVITISFDVGITSVLFDFGTTSNAFVMEGDGVEYLNIGGNFSYLTGTSGIIDFATPITTLEFHDGGLGNIGIDNLRVATVPIPGAVWLLGSSLMPLAVSLRKKKGARRYQT